MRCEVGGLMGFQFLRGVGVNLDGVLLNDSFSPVIHRFVVSRGGVYTAEVERAVLSQSRLEAAAVVGGPEAAPEELVEEFFREREKYLVEHPVRLVEGVRAFLERLRSTGASLVCYGGLGVSHFERFLGPYAEFFDGPKYVCTDGFRPGVREIAEDVFRVQCEQVLFIDDVARVAEGARAENAAFIGHPSAYEYSFQRQLMREAGVRHVVGSLDGVDEWLLRTVDAEAADGCLWPEEGAADG